MSRVTPSLRPSVIMIPCTFCMGSGESGGIVTVDNPNITRFVCQELKIDFDRAVSSINEDPLDLQPDSFAIPLCKKCEKLFALVGRIHGFLDQIKTKLEKVLSEIKQTIVNSPQMKLTELSNRRGQDSRMNRNLRMLRSELIQVTTGKPSSTVTTSDPLAVAFKLEGIEITEPGVTHQEIDELGEEIAKLTETVDEIENIEINTDGMDTFVEEDVEAFKVQPMTCEQNLEPPPVSVQIDRVYSLQTPQVKQVDKKPTKPKAARNRKIVVDPDIEERPTLGGIIRYRCEEPGCKKVFYLRRTLAKHLNSHLLKKSRLDRMSHKCPKPNCDMAYIRLKGLKNHLKSHQLTISRRGCRFCKFTGLPTIVRNHEVTEHSDQLVHSCYKCDQKYSSVSILETHVQIHETKGPYICSICKTSCENPAELEFHLIHLHDIIENEFTEFNCPTCGKQSNTRNAFVAHLRSHEKEKTLNCELCPGKSIPQTNLRQHIVRCHESKQEKKLSCPQCPKQFVTNYMYERHMENHKSAETSQFRCELCETNYKSDLNLQSHIKSKHESRGTLHQCSGLKSDNSKCEKRFQAPTILRRHERKHHPELFIYNCPHCHKCYSVHTFLETHMKTHINVADVKNTSSPFECAVCIVKFSTALQLSTHLLKHTGELECTKCPLIFSDKQSLGVHMIRAHGEKGFKCEICSKSFLQQKYLDLHKEIHIHPDEVPKDLWKTCNICGLQFTTRRLLENHKSAKHRMKPKVGKTICEICAKTILSSTIKEHMKMHEGNKVNICYFCDKGFVRYDALRYHIFTHTLEKPYICKDSSCAAEFNQLHCLKGHIKRVHNNTNQTLTTGPETLYSTSASTQPFHQYPWYPINPVATDMCSLNTASVNLNAGRSIDFDVLMN